MYSCSVDVSGGFSRWQQLLAQIGNLIYLTFRQFHGNVQIIDAYSQNNIASRNISGVLIYPFGIHSTGNCILIKPKKDAIMVSYVAEYELFNKTLMSMQRATVYLSFNMGYLKSTAHGFSHSNILTTYTWIINLDFGRWIQFNWEFSDIAQSRILFRAYGG